MADASFVQDNFTGGEWSAFAKGRITDPDYKRAMSVCFNGIPVEAGPWVRRTGSRELGTTRWGAPGRIHTFFFSQTAPFEMEFTDGHLRLYNKNGLIFTNNPRNVLNISTANPAVITTNADSFESWNTGDTVKFFFPAAGSSNLGGQLLGKEFVLTVVSGNTQFSLVDAVTGLTVDGSQLAYDGNVPIQVARVLDFTSPYVHGDWAQVRFVQDQATVLCLHPNYPPWVLTAAADCGNVFDFRQAQFIDGPYLDPPLDGAFLTPSGQSGQITVTLGYPAYSAGTTYPNGSTYLPNGTRPDITKVSPIYINGTVVTSAGHDYVSLVDNNTGNTPAGNPSKWLQLTDGQVIGPAGFASTDVGRLIRLLSEPADYVPANTYAVNNLVKYQDQYWIALKAIAANDYPGNNVNSWGIATNAATWTWGIITAAGSSRVATVSLVGGNLQYNTTIRVWRLGVYSYSTQFPSCGCLHESRFWLGGAVRNRFDASMSSTHYVMSPTGPDGTVADNNAISYVFDSDEQNQIVFIAPEHNGLVAGTSSCEWSIAASQNQDPLTPTSIQAHRVTKFGCANMEPARGPLALLVVQREQRKVIEYFGDLFSGRETGKNLARDTKHITAPYIEEIVYQQELNPTFWMRLGDGTLAGSTYKRESLMMAQPAEMNGWHRHALGSGRLIKSISVGPSPDGQVDTISMVTQDPTTNIYYVEQLTQLFDEAATVNNAWFLDSAKVPAGASIITMNGVQTLQLDGYATINGYTVEVFVAGVDAGSYVVTNGCVFVPLDGSANGITQASLIAAANNTNFGFNNMPITIPSGVPQQAIQQFAEPSDWTSLAYTLRNTFGAIDWDGQRFFTGLGQSGPNGGLAIYNTQSGALIKRVLNQDIYGNIRPPLWSSTTVYQTAPLVRTTNSKVWASSKGGNVGNEPNNNTPTWWTNSIGSVPNVWQNNVTYGSGAKVCGNNGQAYYKALINLPNRNPLDDDGTQWSPTVPVPGSPIWSQALSFNKGQVVQVTARFHMYVSLSAGNLGNVPQTSPGFWQDQGPVPDLWNIATVYGSAVLVTGSNGHQYASIAANNVNNDPTTDGGVHWTNLNSGAVPSPAANMIWSGTDDKIYMFEGLVGMGRFNSETLKMEALGSFPAAGPSDMVAGGAQTTNGSFGTWVAATDAGISSGNVAPYLFNTATMSMETLPGTMVINEGSRGFVVAAPPGILGVENSCCCATADFYFFGVNAFGTQPSTLSIGMYHMSINPNPVQGEQRISWTKVGTLAPATVDATWTHYASGGGLGFAIYDKTDGNIILYVHTGDAVTNQQYLMKVSPEDFSIIWKTAIPNGDNLPTGAQMKYCNIFNGELFLMTGNAVGGNTITFYVNTMTGTITQGTASHYCTPMMYIYNDVTGTSVQFLVSFQTGAGNDPILLPGTASAFQGFCSMVLGRSHVKYDTPGVVGFNYTSQGQILTPMDPEKSGARNGPAMAKTKRTHMYGIAFSQTAQGGVKVGTDFTSMHPANFESAGGKPFAPGTLFTDTHWDTVENNNGFFSALAWQVTGPYPAAVVAVTQFLHTQDR